jgi:hypothetical protein
VINSDAGLNSNSQYQMTNLFVQDNTLWAKFCHATSVKPKYLPWLCRQLIDDSSYRLNFDLGKKKKIQYHS